MEKEYDKYKLGYHANGRKDIFNERHIYELKDKTEYLDFLLKGTGYTLTNSQRTIPVAGFVHEADITELWSEYKALNERGDRPLKISFNTLMLRIVAECLKAAPILNAHMTYKPFTATGKLEYKEKIEVSMPIIFPNGRMLPLLVHDAGNKNLNELAAYVKDMERRLANTIIEESMFDLSADRLGELIKQGKPLQALCTAIAGVVGPGKLKFPPLKARLAYRKNEKSEDLITKDDIGEGTVCVSDVGSIYSGRGFATTSPVLSPTTAVFAFCRVRDEQRVYKDENGVLQLEYRKILPFTLLFDHKIGGFPDIVPFLNRMDEIIDDPTVIREW
ncbi:MAG: 2-oxo acid dehydrogenase subunit E2 [Clostridia bacterium]|nr:2-oxo acid dehydrogenase subunit E2 [Clostridia bacterium]